MTTQEAIQKNLKIIGQFEQKQANDNIHNVGAIGREINILPESLFLGANP